MTRRKKKRGSSPYPPGYIPPDALFWCALHQRGINLRYLKTKHCIGRDTPCRHLRLLRGGDGGTLERS